MKSLILLSVPLLMSCESLWPHYTEYSVGYGMGTSEFDRPVTSFETDQVAVGFTIGYMSERYFRDSGKSHAYWSNFTGNLSELGEIPGRVQDTGMLESSMFMKLIPDQPDSIEEGLSSLAWAGAILLIGVAILLVAFARSVWNKKKVTDSHE